MRQTAAADRWPALYLVGSSTKEATTGINDAVSIVDALQDFGQWLGAQGASTRTVRERLVVVRAFGRFVDVDPRLAQVQHVITYLGRTDLSAWSRVTYWSALSVWFAWLHSSSQRVDNPLHQLRPPKTPRGAPRPLQPREIDALYAAASPRMRAWLTLGRRAGLRAHEIAKFRGTDIDERTLFVLGKGKVAATLPTHPEIWALAQTYGAGYWFPSTHARGHILPETVSHTSAVFFHSLGIEGSIHRCRHTYATDLLRAGVHVRKVQELMRHSSLNTTARYTAVDEDELREAILRLGAA